MSQEIQADNKYFSLLSEPQVSFVGNRAFFTQMEYGVMRSYFKNIMDINPSDYLNNSLPVDAPIMHPDRMDYKKIIEDTSSVIIKLGQQSQELESNINFYNEQIQNIGLIFQQDMSGLLFKDLGNAEVTAMVFDVVLNFMVMQALMPINSKRPNSNFDYKLNISYRDIDDKNGYGEIYNFNQDAIKQAFYNIFILKKSTFTRQAALNSIDFKYFYDNWDLFYEGVLYHLKKEFKIEEFKPSESHGVYVLTMKAGWFDRFGFSGGMQNVEKSPFLLSFYKIISKIYENNRVMKFAPAYKDQFGNNIYASPSVCQYMLSNGKLNTKYNLLACTRYTATPEHYVDGYKWPHTIDLFLQKYIPKPNEPEQQGYNAIVKVISSVLMNSIESYGMKIKNESTNLQFIIKSLDAHKDMSAYYAAVSKFRDDFNNSIGDVKWTPFPTFDTLEDLSNIKEIPLSIAYEYYCSTNSYQNISFVYPRVVVDHAIYTCLVKEKTNFSLLTNEKKEYYLNMAIADLETNLYKTKELSEKITHRKNLDKKFIETLTSIDSNYAKIRLTKIVRETLAANPDYKPNVGFDFDNSMGFFKVKWPKLKVSFPTIKISAPKIELPKITLPRIVIPPIKIPEINIVNIVLPKSINPIEGVLSFIGTSDSFKEMMTKAANDAVRSPIYIPVVSEAVKGAEDIANTVVKAGGQFIEATGQFIVNSPQMAADILKATGKAANDLIISPAESIVDGVCYAVLPRDIAEKIDKITDLPSKAATGKLTEKDLREAGQAALKLAIAPAAFAGKITADTIDTAIKVVPLVAELDQYSGGILSSSSRIARSTHIEYESKAHDPRTVLDIIKIGMTIASAGSVSVALENIASNTVYTALADKTGVGSTELKAIVAAYNSGDITGAASDYAKNTAIKETAKEVEEKTGVPAVALTTVASGVDSGKSVSEAVYDTAKDQVKKEISKEVQKKIGLPISADDILEFNVSKLLDYENLPSVEEVVSTLEKSIEKEYDKRYQEVLNIANQIENYSSEDVWADTKRMLEKEKEKVVNKLYTDFYDLKKKYYPEALLNYLMLRYGPRPHYDDVEIPQDIDWETWQQPPEPIYVHETKKGLNPAVVTGLVVGAVAIGMAIQE